MNTGRKLLALRGQVAGGGVRLKTLVIEDDQQVIRDITFCLQVRYPDVVVVSVGEGLSGIEMVETEAPDLVLVEASLPDVDSLELVGRIREFSDVPLIVLSESETDLDRARGLEVGVDEYVSKPFSPIEFLARVKALLRRADGVGFRPEHTVSFGDGLAINFTTHEVFLCGEHLNLTPTEYRLLSELMRNEGRVLTHRTLLDRVWGPEYDGDSSFTKRYIYRLRQKLHDDSANPRIIRTERGLGYRFVTPT